MKIEQVVKLNVKNIKEYAQNIINVATELDYITYNFKHLTETECAVLDDNLETIIGGLKQFSVTMEQNVTRISKIAEEKRIKEEKEEQKLREEESEKIAEQEIANKEASIPDDIPF